MSVHEPRRRDRLAKLFASRKKGKGDDAGSTIEEPPSSEIEPYTMSKSQSALVPPNLESKGTDVQKDPSFEAVDATNVPLLPKTTEF